VHEDVVRRTRSAVRWHYGAQRHRMPGSGLTT